MDIGYHQVVNNSIYFYLIWSNRWLVDEYTHYVGLVLLGASLLFLYTLNAQYKNFHKQNTKTVRSQRSNKSYKSEKSKQMKMDSFRSHLEQLDEPKKRSINQKEILLEEVSVSKRDDYSSKVSAESENEDELLLKE